MSDVVSLSKSGWKKVRIGDVCTIEKGATGIASATPGKYPMVTTGAERKTCAEYQFDTEAACIPLVSSTGHGKKTLNYVHYQSGKFALGTILAAVIPKKPTDLSARYLHLYLHHFKNSVLVPLMKGAANVSLPMKGIADVEVPLPPIQRQLSTVDLVCRLENEHKELIDENENQLTLLKLLRQAILQEAVEGRLTADWRKKNPVRKGDPEFDAGALVERIRGEKEKLIKEGKIGKEKPIAPIEEEVKPFEVPVGWVWTRVAELAGTLSTGPFGSMLHKSDYVKNGIPIVNPTNIVGGQIVSDERMLVSRSTRERLNRYVLEDGDVVIARRGNLQKCASVNADQVGWLCGTGSFFLRLLKVNISFFVLAYCSAKSQAYLLQDSVGQTMDNLNQKLLFKMPMGIPPLAEQRAIVSRVDSLTSLLTELENQIITRKSQSEQLMQSVLREAFQGGQNGGQQGN